LSHAVKKYATKYDPQTIGAKFQQSKALAIQGETEAINRNALLEQRVKQTLRNDNISSTQLLAYFYVAESAQLLVRKYKAGTLTLEASLLRFKWLQQGLELDLLDKVLFVAGVDVNKLMMWNVGAPILPQPLGSGVLNADGSEQLVAEITGLNRIMGYVNLINLQAGDSVILKQYVKLLFLGSYSKYDEQPYSDVQPDPVIYIRSKESQFGVKITLQQTGGVNRSFEYDFFKEA
jgi:hypothetical protein